jgi:hypothetical protein
MHIPAVLFTHNGAVIVDRPAALFFLASVVLLGFSWLLRQRHAVALSWLILVLWTYTKVAAYLWGWDTARLLMPAGDVLALSFASFIWYLEPRQWKLGVVWATLTKLFIHTIFWRDGVQTIHTKSDLYNYSLSLNILTAIDILCVAMAGSEIIADALGRWLSPGGTGHRWVGAFRGRSAARSKP